MRPGLVRVLAGKNRCSSIDFPVEGEVVCPPSTGGRVVESVDRLSPAPMTVGEGLSSAFRRERRRRPPDRAPTGGW